MAKFAAEQFAQRYDRDKRNERNQNKLAIMIEALEFIAGQKDKTGNWAVEIAKRTLKECDNINKG